MTVGLIRLTSFRVALSSLGVLENLVALLEIRDSRRLCPEPFTGDERLVFVMEGKHHLSDARMVGVNKK